MHFSASVPALSTYLKKKTCSGVNTKSKTVAFQTVYSAYSAIGKQGQGAYY